MLAGSETQLSLTHAALERRGARKRILIREPKTERVLQTLINLAKGNRLGITKRVLALSVITTFLGAGSNVNAGITGTSVYAGMRIDIGSITEVSGSDAHPTYASVDLLSPSTGAHVSSLLNLNSLSAESANLNFNLLLDGNNTSRSGYLGGNDVVDIFYHNDRDVVVGYSWNFDYSGPNPWGLSVIWLQVDNVAVIAQLGDVGIVGHHEGSGTFTLSSGNPFPIRVDFGPNVQGGMGFVDGTLTGNISFTFVPEPATLSLFGLGAAALLISCRRN